MPKRAATTAPASKVKLWFVRGGHHKAVIIPISEQAATVKAFEGAGWTLERAKSY